MYSNRGDEWGCKSKSGTEIHPESISNELLCCPFCGGKATLIKKEDSYWPRDMVTCKNEECELTDWIPYDDWQRRAR